MFENIKIGDPVIRLLAGTVPMKLLVTEMTEDTVVCGWWTFDRATGAEIDEDLGWGATPLHTGSYIKLA